jgi:predicted P-loop ATPase
VLNDAALDRLYLVIEETYRFSPPKDYFLMVLMDHARTNPVHPVLDYLKSLTWDRVPRLDRWLVDHAGAEDSALIREISSKTLIAAVRRVRQPGVKFDEMLVLESKQGQLKSSAILALCPNDAWFSDDLPLNVDAKQIIERTRGKWIIEASDLSGMRKGDVEHLKAMLSRCVDGPVRMAYQHLAEERPRAFILVGTTNSRAYLKDSTGNRRFWPVRVQVFDIDLLRKNRDQLWAEAAARETAGESIRLDPKYYKEMGGAQEERVIGDLWAEQLLDSDIDWTQPRIPVDAVNALLQVNAHDPRAAERLHQVMQKLGYPKKHRCRHNGRFAHHWLREDDDLAFTLEPESGRPKFIKKGEE